MKIVALPCGKQCAIHGPTVNIPTDLMSVCTRVALAVYASVHVHIMHDSI